MNKKERLSLIAILLMTLFSFSGLLILFDENIMNFASITLIIGIVFYFVTRQPEEKDAMSLKAIPQLLKDWKNILLVLMPIASSIICNVIARLFLPEFIEHLSERTDFLTFDKILFLVVELVVAAFGEEIAWRGFYLNQLCKKIPLIPSLLISAILFSICHFSMGSIVVVLYDLLFIVIDAVLYGIVYKKTNNIIVSTISHFLANLFSVFTILLI